MMVTQILGMDATDIAELKPIMRVRGLWGSNIPPGKLGCFVRGRGDPLPPISANLEAR